jgi:hypothetical protein
LDDLLDELSLNDSEVVLVLMLVVLLLTPQGSALLFLRSFGDVLVMIFGAATTRSRLPCFVASPLQGA